MQKRQPGCIEQGIYRSRCMGVALFGIISLTMLLVSFISLGQRTGVCFFSMVNTIHMGFIALSKRLRRQSYDRSWVLHDVACLFLTLPSVIVAVHIWPCKSSLAVATIHTILPHQCLLGSVNAVRAGSPINAFWGGIRHACIGVADGASLRA